MPTRCGRRGGWPRRTAVLPAGLVSRLGVPPTAPQHGVKRTAPEGAAGRAARRWRVYGAPQPFPYADEQLGKQGRRMQPDETGPLSLDALLRQGDALYLPRG